MRKGRSSKLVFAFLALTVSPYPACAQAVSTSINKNAEKPECGASASDALNTARQQLASAAPNADRTTLACLIAAREEINTRVGKLETAPRELRAPLWVDDNAAPAR